MKTYRRYRFQPSGYLSSYASGSEASRLRSDVENVRSLLNSAESVNAGTVRDFDNTFLDARFENWDGYGAQSVKDGTFRRAREFLRQCLGRYPAPVSAATPRGWLALEWYVAPDRRFVVSIGEGEQIAYAGLWGAGSTVSGTETFLQEVPPSLWKHLDRLYPQ